MTDRLGESELIEDLVAANRILAQQGVLDGFGHVSVRHPGDSNRFLMSRSLAPELVTAKDILEYDLDANALTGKEQSLYLERFIHSAIYKARPDVSSVVHNHSPSLIPFGVSSVVLRPVSHLAAFIGESLPVFDIRTSCGMTNMLVSDPERARGLVQILAKHTAVLMRGHGSTVVGPTIRFAVGRSIYLEVNARLQAQAIALGGEITYLHPEEAQAMMDFGENNGYSRPWELWKKKAMGY